MKIKIILGIIMAVLSVNLMSAQTSNTYELARQGLGLTHKLEQLVNQNPENLCVGDITGAALYIKVAAHELIRGNPHLALTSFVYGQKELQEISRSRTYCAQLAPQLVPFNEKVLFILKELERQLFKTKAHSYSNLT